MNIDQLRYFFKLICSYTDQGDAVMSSIDGRLMDICDSEFLFHSKSEEVQLKEHRTHLKNSFIYELEDAINKEGYDFEKCFNFKVHVTEGYYYAGWYEKMDLILEDYHTAVIQVSDLAEKCSDELF